MEKEARSQKPEARRGISAWGPIIRAFRSTLQTSGFWLLASGFFPLVPPSHAEVIDRIMAVVEGHIVTRGDLRQEREIRERLGEKPVEDDKALVQELIDNYLIERRRAGQNTVLILDEAQNLDADTLEQVRLLSNFETPTDKLLQILLVGQPELKDKLALPSLRQLKQRIGLLVERFAQDCNSLESKVLDD